MVQGKFVKGGAGLSDAFSIRTEVFVREQKIPDELEFDDLDKEAHHVVIYEGYQEKAAATGRLVINEGKACLQRIAVLKEYRGNRYGDLVVRMLLEKAKSLDINDVYVNAQLQAVGFYEKCGFNKAGNPFIEAGIPHIRMNYYQRKDCSCQQNKKNKEN